jgi:hypothetical protein
MARQLESLAAQTERIQNQRLVLLEISSYGDQLNVSDTDTARFDVPQSFAADTSSSRPTAASLAPDDSTQDHRGNTQLLQIRRTLRLAYLYRSQALDLLQAAGATTSTPSLDAIDLRVAATSRTFDNIGR